MAIGYVISCWLLLQVADLAFDIIGTPDWAIRSIAAILALGFPVVLFFSWAYELTPEGIKRESEVGPAESISHVTGRRLDKVIIPVLLAAVAFLVVDKYLLDDRSAPASNAVPNASVTTPSAKPAHETTSIAVLPFTNMSSDPDQEYFSDGMAEELLNALSKLQNLQVAARTSSFAFKGQNLNITDIGNTLNVNTVLEGSVRKSGNRLRITAQLIDVANGYHLWSETYDRELSDIFAIQDELTAAIVDALKVHLNVDEAVKPATIIDNWEAYDAYLKGLHAVRKRTNESVAEAIAYFELAVSLEPTFAAALAQQAQAVLLSGANRYTPLEEAKERGKQLLARALNQNPELAEAYAARGLLAMLNKDCEKALPDFEKSRSLNPGLIEALHWNSLCLTRLGRLQESAQLAQRAHQLDPLHPSVFTTLSDFNLSYGMVVELNLDAIQRNFPERSKEIRIKTLRAQGEWAEALALCASLTDPELMLRCKLDSKAQLAEEDRMLLDRLKASNERDAQSLYLWNLVVFNHIAEAEQHLTGLTDSDLTLTSHDAWLSTIKYRGGSLAEAESLLTQSAGGDVISPGYPNRLNSRVNQVINLADVLQQRGQTESAEANLSKARNAIDAFKRSGARAGYQWSEARLSILEGHPAAAVRLLKDASENGQLVWHSFSCPIINRLSEDPEFVAVKAKLYEHINAEREKLGWAPVAVGNQSN
ncbi:MAG: hypothetical protein ABJ084_03750 [Halioglobus sp.]